MESYVEKFWKKIRLEQQYQHKTIYLKVKCRPVFIEALSEIANMETAELSNCGYRGRKFGVFLRQGKKVRATEAVSYTEEVGYRAACTGSEGRERCSSMQNMRGQ